MTTFREKVAETYQSLCDDNKHDLAPLDNLAVLMNYVDLLEERVVELSDPEERENCLAFPFPGN